MQPELIKIVGKDKHYNKLGLYKCECGNEFIRQVCIVNKHIKQNRKVSCGCKKNHDKRKPFPVELIPDQYKKFIEPDIGSFSLGNYHHAQWCSKVICPLCGFSKIQRNERVLYSLLHYGCPYVCQKCGGGKALKKYIDPDLVKEIQKEYLEGDMSWKELAEKYNLSEHVIYDRAGGKLLTKMRRVRRRRESVARMEKELLFQERNFVENKKKELDKWVNEIESIVGK